MITLAIFVILLGCTTKQTDVEAPTATKNVSNIDLESPGWLDSGYQIYDRFTCFGDNVSPALTLKNIPPETKSLAIVMYDEDTPSGMFIHWIVYNIPADKTSFAQGETFGTMIKNDFGKLSYVGPCPPEGNSHHYIIEVFALDTEDLGSIADKGVFISEIEAHTIARGLVSGYYSI
jgi:Raf kinase inhibitor-like YbhB/YbcL family protein